MRRELDERRRCRREERRERGGGGGLQRRDKGGDHYGPFGFLCICRLIILFLCCKIFFYTGMNIMYCLLIINVCVCMKLRKIDEIKNLG